MSNPSRSVYRLFALATAASMLVALHGCAAGTEYKVGDCLKMSVNEEGQAIRADCSDPESFEVTMLAKNGARPNCPYYVGEDYSSSGAIYVTDTTTNITYCGKPNGPY